MRRRLGDADPAGGYEELAGSLRSYRREGGSFEGTPAGERHPGAPRTLSRAARTRMATGLGADRVWPYWLQRQLDPASPDVADRSELRLINVTARNWTAVGTVASPHKGIVDERGLLTPWYDGWSLDWWIGAEDRWHLPPLEPAVRQLAVEDTPVVETVMRVPGGDAAQRVYAVPGDPPMAVMEITNRTSTPFAVAFAIRPYNPLGAAVVERIEVDDRIVRVDGRTALVLPRRPARVAATRFCDGDSAAIVLSGDASEEFPEGLRCDAGLASAAFLSPLAHTATVRVAVPLDAADVTPVRPRLRRGRRGGGAGGVAPAITEAPGPVPASDDVVRGWQAQTANRGLRLVVPEGRLASAIEANRRYLLLSHEGTDVVAGPFTGHHFSFLDAASILCALDLWGLHRQSGEVLRSYPARQRANGRFVAGDGLDGANGAALWAMAEHWRLTGSLDDLHPVSVAGAARRLGRSSRRDAQRGVDEAWSLRGLTGGVALLAAFGQHRAAEEARKRAGDLAGVVARRTAEAVAQMGSAAATKRAAAEVSDPIVGSLSGAWALSGCLGAGHPSVTAAVEGVRRLACVGAAVHGRSGLGGSGDPGLSPTLTLQLASLELEGGDRRCLERLSWLLQVSSPTYAWATAIDPDRGGGGGGEGHDGRVAAEFLSLVRRLLVREVEGGLALCSMLPEAWQGQNLEVHDAPTHHGLVSFAVRWHGSRPALLWDVRVHAPGPVRLSAPGLDPSWSTTEPRGDALLAASAVTIAPGDSFS